MVDGPISADYRLPKDYAVSLVVQLAPEYVEMLNAFRTSDGSLQLPRKFLDLRDQLNINNYSELYNDERKINVSALLALFGDDGFKELNSEISKMSPAEMPAFLMELVQEGESWDLSGFFPPDTEDARAKAESEFEFEQLTDADKKATAKRVQFFWSFLFKVDPSVKTLMHRV